MTPATMPPSKASARGQAPPRPHALRALEITLNTRK